MVSNRSQYTVGRLTAPATLFMVYGCDLVPFPQAGLILGYYATSVVQDSIWKSVGGVRKIMGVGTLNVVPTPLHSLSS